MADNDNQSKECDVELTSEAQSLMRGFFKYFSEFSDKRSLDNAAKDTISCVAISSDSQIVVGGGWKIIRL